MELFTVTPGARVDSNVHTIIICRSNDLDECLNVNPFVLMESQPIFENSQVCLNMSKLITKDEIATINPAHIKIECSIKDIQRAIIFPEPREYFTDGIFETARDFYNYCKFADKYDLDIVSVCSNYDRMGWLLVIKERQKDLWRANGILLSNVEQREFSKPKFIPVNSANTNPGAYPVGYVPAGKSITLGEISIPEFLNREEFTELIHILSRGHAYDLIAKIVAILGSSIEYCHYILDNESVVKLTRGLPSFNGALKYGFRVMYLEELSMYARKRGPGRFIMNINSASNLPSVQIDMKKSPYYATAARGVSICLDLPNKLEGSRGLYNLTNFRRRLDIFSEGSLAFIEWELPGAKTVVSGSTITACASRTPFENSFDTTEEYFEEYYPSRKSEIQHARENITKENVLFTYDNIDDESSQVSDLDAPTHDNADVTSVIVVDEYSEDENEDEDEYSEEEDENENVKNTAAAATGDNFEHQIGFSDIDLMVECQWELFDEIAETHFRSIQKSTRETLTMERVETENKHKYIIHGLNRDIDIFHVNDIPSVIVKFHLDCVRAWYDGNNVWCFPSFVCANKLGMNMDIRWTSNRKDVRDIVLKYFQRGFGTLLNPIDAENIRRYINRSKLWPAMIEPSGRWNRRYFSSLSFFETLKREIFNPSVSKFGIHKSITTIPKHIEIPVIRKFSRGNNVRGNRSGVRNGIVLPSVHHQLALYL